jgi:branched-chain amino acid transport system substrate-binding protein
MIQQCFKAIRAITTGLVLAAGAVGFGLAGAQAAEPIKVGTFLAVTGPASFLGDPELKTL